MGIRGSIMKDPVFESNHRDTLLYAIDRALWEVVGVEQNLRSKHCQLKEDSYEANAMMQDIEKVAALAEKLVGLCNDVRRDVNNRHIDEYYQEYLALYTVVQMITR